MSKRLRAKAWMLCAVLGACQGAVNTPDDPSTDMELGDHQGSVELALTTVAASGTVYRLRYATFDVSGAQTVRLSTREDLGTNDAESLDTPLLIGAYSVTLQPGWQLLRVAADGTEHGVTAVITSANPLAFNVSSQHKTSLSFQFHITNGEAVSFGDAEIGIAVDETPSATLFATESSQSSSDASHSRWLSLNADALTMEASTPVPGFVVGLTASSAGVYTLSQQSRQITRWDFDGSLLAQRTHTNEPRDIAIDPVHNVLFMSDQSVGSLFRLDGLLQAPPVQLNIPFAQDPLTIAYDQSSDRLYYAPRGSTLLLQGKISFFANPGQAGGGSVDAWQVQGPIWDLTVDAQGTVYWLSQMGVMRARVGEQPVMLFGAPGEARCIAVDSATGHVFLGGGFNGGAGQIASYNMSGVLLATHPAKIDDLCGLAVLPTVPDSADYDHDGLSDHADNCPYVANPSQNDTDADGVGEACDNCPNNPNPTQSDRDGNGIGDACDVCPTRYQDADNDGKGNPTVSAPLCDATAGYVDNALDCNDADARVYTGQTQFFSTPRADNSFDYNCDGAITLSITQTGACGIICRPGWLGAVPGCGASGTYVQCPSQLGSCVKSSKVQACH